MPRLWLGLLAGLVYGALSAASMLRMQFPDKRAALLGAFLNRLAIGIVIGAAAGAPQLVALRAPPWVLGLVAGLLLSAADAVITKACAASPARGHEPPRVATAHRHHSRASAVRSCARRSAGRPVTT